MNNNEERLKIKRIRRNKAGIIACNIMQFVMCGLISICAFESYYFFKLIFNGYETGNGKLYDNLLAAAPILITYFPIIGIKRLNKAKLECIETIEKLSK